MVNLFGKEFLVLNLSIPILYETNQFKRIDCKNIFIIYQNKGLYSIYNKSTILSRFFINFLCNFIEYFKVGVIYRSVTIFGSQQINLLSLIFICQPKCNTSQQITMPSLLIPKRKNKKHYCFNLLVSDAITSTTSRRRRGLLILSLCAFFFTALNLDFKSVRDLEDDSSHHTSLLLQETALQNASLELERRERALNLAQAVLSHNLSTLAQKEQELKNKTAAEEKEGEDYVSGCVMVMDANHELM